MHDRSVLFLSGPGENGAIAATLSSLPYTSGAARELLSLRHLGVKITDFTDFHHILCVFQLFLRKLGSYLTSERPQELPLIDIARMGQKQALPASKSVCLLQTAVLRVLRPTSRLKKEKNKSVPTKSAKGGGGSC